MILKRFIQFIIESEGIDYCQQNDQTISLDQIKYNLEINFDQQFFILPISIIHQFIITWKIKQLMDHYLTNILLKLSRVVMTLEIKIPIKNMETNQNAVEFPLSGLIITVKQEYRGFIHIFIFESDEGIIINYKEDDNLAYITIAQTDSKIFIFSFVTSSFTKFPQIEIIQHVFQDFVTEQTLIV
ncbi:unnamed protein product [Paramecium sonneborni]|uniref:Uncharacterized protein n=1 Tax=Paramecium sonneborni TaxID=65129 RepID=A0A8S1KFD5_9CILI|nr:unnamed protein product [Paramecium sonneborni]